MAAQAQRAASGAALQRQNAANAAMMRGRGRPQTITKPSATGTVLRNNQQPLRPQIPGMVLPNNFQLGAAGQYIQVRIDCFFCGSLHFIQLLGIRS